MPELPEVQTIVSELNSKLRGEKIINIQVKTAKMIHVGPAVVSNIRKSSASTASKFINLLEGRKILSVTRRAKLLIFNLSGQVFLLVHLKMTGQFIFEDKKLRAKTNGHYRMFNKLSAPKVRLPSKHTHVIFKFASGSTLYFNDIRKFGYMKVVAGDEIKQVRELNEYGPEPLDKKFTLFAFCVRTQKANKRKTSIKQLLMDNSFVVGIGNIYSDEILFLSGIRPTRKVLTITKQEYEKIYFNIIKVLKIAIKAKGSSVGDFVRTNGSWGQMGKFHFVYGRKGQECKNCGTIIQSVKLGGRTSSFCPNCQK